MGELLEPETIAGCIIELRGQRVMLDADLAALYGVETKRLNQQVRRNPGRFPSDFMFALTTEEWQGLRLQNASTLRRSKRRNVAPLGREVERQNGKLTTHDAAILKLLAEIRRLTQFPESPSRGIGFTAEWPKGR